MTLRHQVGSSCHCLSSFMTCNPGHVITSSEWMPVPCAGPKGELGGSVSLQASAALGGTADLKPNYSDTMIYRRPYLPYSMCSLRRLILRPCKFEDVCLFQQARF